MILFSDEAGISLEPKLGTVWSLKGVHIKDLILFYSKSDNLIWNEPKISYSEEDKLKLFPKKDKDGRHYTTIPLHAPG